MPTLRDIFELPEQVRQGDFVLQLTSGLNGKESSEATVRDYVVTPQLVQCFDAALGVVKGALDSRASKGAYLHGSFGAGKSHFMAMLTLLLRSDPVARAKPELAGVVSKHNSWTQDKRFLVVPYHMINAQSFEVALFSGYAEYISKHHPDAPSPGFYQRDGILQDAANLRTSMGDEAFFERLNQSDGSASKGGWGKLGRKWPVERYDSVTQLAPGNPERYELIGALVRAFFANMSHLAASEAELYTSLDDGLSAMSHHAAKLGYQGVILFLDEFILWLASRAADTAWVAREGQKVAKLVESGNADRPVPIISFMARQRDLRELVGAHMPGAEQLSFADVLQYWEARFDKVTLEDRNLPEIVKKRLLRTRGPAQEAQLSAAVGKLLSSHGEVVQTLLTRDGDQKMLQDLYPFTPALVQTLVAVSGMLQRERTALKLMQQMLVERADSMEIGEVIPVGDLYDVIANGDEPFTHGVKLFFEQAKQLWRRRLLPILETQHGITWDDIENGRADPKKANLLRNDARLIKTLVLAALVPEVDALKNLTPTRLAALNHGTIRTPVPGSEGSTVLTKLKRWAGQAGEIKIADDSPNPVITLEVAKVDTDSILANAMRFDSFGNRQAEVRNLILDGLGLAEAANAILPPTLNLSWRGSARSVEILFGNVREQSFDTLAGREGTWRILVDFPFDSPDHGPTDDVAKLNSFLNEGRTGRTLVWLPSFLSPGTQDQLARLVVLNTVLRGNNLEQNSAHLSQTDREQARVLLANQRDQLRQYIRNSLQTAYGLNNLTQEALDPAQLVEEHFLTLEPALNVRPPVAATFSEAFGKLAEQALEFEFPKHPHFDAEPRPVAVKRLAEVLLAAAQNETRRAEFDISLKDDAKRILPKLELAHVGDGALQLADEWGQHFARMVAQQSGREPTIALLRQWLDEPEKRGLRPDLQNLILLTWLAKTNRSLVRFGQPFTPSLENLPNECEVRELVLPGVQEWDAATQIGGRIFAPELQGLYRGAPGLQRFGKILRAVVRERAPWLHSYLTVINSLTELLGVATLLPGEAQQRKPGAQRLLEACQRIDTCSNDFELVKLAAALQFGQEEEAEAKALLAGAEPLAKLEAKRFLVNSLQSIANGSGEFSAPATQILEHLAHAVLRHEYVISLKTALTEFDNAASALMANVANRAAPQTVPVVVPEPVTDAAQAPNARIFSCRATDTRTALSTLAEAQSLLAGLAGASVDIQIVIREQS